LTGGHGMTETGASLRVQCSGPCIGCSCSCLAE
jgi:hypothetical protein